MELVELKPINYKEWDNFCESSDDAWFWHSSSWLEANLNFKPESKPISKSFFLKENKKIVAICPLMLEAVQKSINEFSFSGGYGPTPALANFLSKRVKEKTLKLIFERIDDLATGNNVKRIKMRFSVLSKAFIENGEQRANYLMKFGYIDNSLNTQVIDMTKTLDELRLDLRHGHDSDIDRASKFLKEEIFDKNNITKKIFNKYVKMHLLAGGKARKNRPKRTFDIMYELIKEDRAFLVGAKKNNSFIGFSYFSVFKDNVYYGSSCTDPKNKDLPVAHFIQWKAIEWMKQKKYKFYELGWQYYSPTLSEFPTQKEIDIARFKRGFGGFTLPLFRGEKYYDKKYFLKIYQNRINKFSDSIL